MKTTEAVKTAIEWMRVGVPVWFSPGYGPKGPIKGVKFKGLIGSKPFLVGNPKNDRWVVRITDLDDNYVQIFNRTVHATAPISMVTRRETP